MSIRDCESCVHAKPFGGDNDNRCSAWSCEYINRDEAIEAYEIVKAMKESEAKVKEVVKDYIVATYGGIDNL